MKAESEQIMEQKALSEMTLAEVGRLTEDEAWEQMEAIRWPDGQVCPHCDGKDVTRVNGNSKKVRRGLIQCNKCRGQFTVRMGSVFESSHLSLRTWLMAYHLIASSKKGISSLQIRDRRSSRKQAFQFKLKAKDMTLAGTPSLPVRRIQFDLAFGAQPSEGEASPEAIEAKTKEI